MWIAAVAVAYGGLVALAYAVGPAAQPGCGVGGRGEITTANGDHASFGLLVAGTPPRGASAYQDAGPRRPVKVSSVRVATLTCDLTAHRAVLTGTAKVNAATMSTYRVDIGLAGGGAASLDTYRITLSNGYDSGTQTARRANLTISSAGKQLARRTP
jgi:hypothetical protein